MANAEHARHILSLLAEPATASSSYLAPIYLETRGVPSLPLPHPLWRNQLQWKWFLRDIGKQACVVGLLPFIEVATHLKNTHPVEEDSPTAPSKDELRSFDRKVALLTAWGTLPSRATKRELFSVLPPGNPSVLALLYLDGKAPEQIAVAFINQLMLTVMANRHFSNHVFLAFSCLAHLGYPDWRVSRVFKETVSRHYVQQLSE